LLKQKIYNKKGIQLTDVRWWLY